MATALQDKLGEIAERYETATIEYETAVEEMELAILSENEFTVEAVIEGNTVVLPDMDAVKEKVAEVVIAAKVTTPEERAINGLSRGDLFAAVLPAHVVNDDASKVEKQAVRNLTRKLWGNTQTAPGSFLQRRVPDGLFLIKSKVARGHDEVEVVFVTDNDELVLAGLLMPAIEAYVKVATKKVSAIGTLIVGRKLGLGTRVLKAIEQGNKKARAASQPDMPGTEDEA